MTRRHGYPLRRLPYRDWYLELAAAMERGQENALSKFFPLFGEDMPSADAGDEGSEPCFERKNLLAAVAGSGIECRALDQEMMSLYLDYFIATGYLPPPGHAKSLSEGSLTTESTTSRSMTEGAMQ